MASGVILGSNGRPAIEQAKTPLFVVRDLDQHDTSTILICRTCQMRGEESRFYADELNAYIRHVALCSSRHEAELRARSLRVKSPDLFDPDVSGDVERGKWIRQHRRAIIEGRKKS